MARKVSFSALESRSARLRLKIRRRPYSGPSLARGIMLTVQLAAKLKEAAKGCADNAPLLLQGDGKPWDKNPGQNYHRQVDKVVTAIGLDPAVVTMYALRHSSIVRMLKKNIPIRLVASLHNTSVAMIEKHYSKFITEHAIDDIARAGLLSEPAPAGDNVVSIAGR
jgi:integrase